MLRRSIAGFLGLALLCGALAAVATASDKDKDSTKKDAKDKDVKKEGKEFEGKITKIDVDKMTFSIKGDDGKTLDFKFDDDTKFLGPRGGKRDKKDDQFTVGKEIKVEASAAGKVATAIHLSTRDGKDDKDGKDKDKDKDKKAKDKDDKDKDKKAKDKDDKDKKDKDKKDKDK